LFLKSKGINLDFDLVNQIGESEYSKLLGRYISAGVVKNNQDAEEKLKSTIEEYDIWLAKGNGKGNQYAELLTL